MSKFRAKRQVQRQIKRQRNTIILLVTGGLLLVAAGISIGSNIINNIADPSVVEVKGQPSLRVDQELIDYGEVKLNTNLTFDLRLTNVGDQPLNISSTPYVEVLEGC